MLTVYKYPITQAHNAIEMPSGAQVLRIGIDPAVDVKDLIWLRLWALVDTDNPIVVRKFIITGTGHPLPTDKRNLVYIGSSVCSPFIWHVFEDLRQ
jgi:hypothetical protein